MPLRAWFARAGVQPGAPGVKAVRVPVGDWLNVARDVAASGGRLLALWGSGDGTGSAVVRASYLAPQGVLLVTLPLETPAAGYPSLEEVFPAAGRMQRAIADMMGLAPTGSLDSRPWLRHSGWPPNFRPLVDENPPAGEACSDSYEFVRVEGDGVHEIPVGPVHAGIIEPGHFRFSVVGEKVLRLEERLGYVHKGIERRFTELPILEGHRLAARVSGDSAVAFAWGYCQALEGMARADIPPRAHFLRALFLELERIANHLGDLGALGNDAGFAFGLAQFSRLKEELLRTNSRVMGQRYLMDAVVPGGTARDLTPNGPAQIRVCLTAIASEVATLRDIYDEHEGVRDRFNGAGTVSPELAARLGLLGLAGRASGQDVDVRCDLPCEPYSRMVVKKVIRTEGDVAARVAVRFDEFQESYRLVQELLAGIPAGPHHTPIEPPADGEIGTGLIEGWRGPVWIALEAGPAGSIRRCHPHDPSWQNWPVLEHAIIGNIVPDFPLINKSFNLSYSGHDL